MTPSGATSTNPLPECPAYQHLILPPLDSNTAPPESECLLLLVPSALVNAATFEPLARAVQAAAPGLRLWVSVVERDVLALLKLYGGDDVFARGDAAFQAAIDAMHAADVFGTLLRQAVEQTVGRGFVPRKEGPAGRLANMVALCQGYQAPKHWVPHAAPMCTALVLLGASLSPQPEEALRRTRSLEAWPRPVLVLSGEMDGMARWPWQAPYLGELAAMAAKFGPGYAATHKPVLVVPGLNQGNTIDGVAPTARGDIGNPACVAEHQGSLKAVGRHVAHFLTAHLGASLEQQNEASGKLLEAVRQSMQHVAPYCTALGLGDVVAPFDPMAGALPPMQPPYGATRNGGLAAGAGRSVGSVESSALHPGVVAAAESTACAAQGQVLGALPQEARERVAVAATAHTSANTFIYAQPTLTPSGGGRWLLHVHVLLHYRFADEGKNHIGLMPFAPEHWLKLKSAEHVAQILGLPEPSRYLTPPPAALCRSTLAAALASVPREVAQRYEQYGRKLEPKEDREWSHVKAPQWLQDSRITYTESPATPPPPSADGATDSTATTTNTTATPPPSVTLSCPYVLRALEPLDTVPKLGDLPFDSAWERFSGAYYVKMPSLAQMVEWVWLDCLRDKL